jgi:[acyl-carrier-protein] S-malonyltransferase
MSRIAAVFPNEGSQYVGMGRDFYSKSIPIRKYYDDVEKVFGMKIVKICFLGPKEEQDKLLHAQLSVFMNDVAFFGPLVLNRRKPEILTGVGVGEIAALVVAECLPFINAAQFIVKRAEILQTFIQKQGGSVAGISGVTLDQLQPLLARKEGLLTITQYLSPQTFIVWGSNEAVGSLQTELQGVKNVKTNILLPRGPVFSEKTAELEPEFERLLDECLGEVELKHPQITFHSCSDGKYVGTVDGVRDVLVRQLSRPVDWIKTVKEINFRGFRTWVEVGPGRLYSGLVKKIDNDNRITNVEDGKSLTTMVKVTG